MRSLQYISYKFRHQHCITQPNISHTYNPAGTRRLCNVRLTLDMTSDRRCILIENENRVDVNIWRQFDVDLTLDFGYTT